MVTRTDISPGLLHALYPYDILEKLGEITHQ